jgi:hypothetical protein
MVLQQTGIEKSLTYPQAEIKKAVDQLSLKEQEAAEADLLHEREEFVKHIEAFCDCV